MNKAQLVSRMSKESGLTKAASGKALDALIAIVTRSLRKGERVVLVGFGTFLVSKRKARMVKNPQSGAPLRIPARRVARFSAGKDLKAVVK